MFKRILSLILVALLLTLAGCGGKHADNRIFLLKKYGLPEEMRTVKSSVVAENGKMELSWDVDKSCVLLKDKESGTVWSTIPYDFYSKNESAILYVEDGICSSLKITYVDSEKHNEVELNSNSDAEYILASKLKNGIRVTYYFEKAQISVPVLFRLEEDGVSVSLDIRGITETQNKIYKVSLTPFFASCKNGKDSYLFVPSGSGALMYTDDDYRESRIYSEPVYGEDLAEQSIYKTTSTESVRMPVFGAKSGSDAILGVITAGDDIAEINAIAGDEQYGFSGAYASFILRGKTESNLKGQSNQNSQMIKYSDGLVSLNRATVRYIMVPSDKSDYNGMAQIYRKYLSENQGLKSNVIPKDTVLTFLGGGLKRKLFLGVPYNTYVPLTTTEETEKIIDSVRKDTNASMAVNLKGYGIGGLDNTDIGGGFKVEKSVGGKKAIIEFMEKSYKNKIDAFYDFELISFINSSNGYSKRQAAITPSGVRAKAYEYTIVIREQDKTKYRYLNSRYKIAASANDVLVAAGGFGIKGVSLSSLVNTSFSDYSSPDYYCKANMSTDVERLLKIIKKQGFKTMGESANIYAATNLDYIFNTPATSSMYNSLDKDIPFYQMVLRGGTGLTGGVINLSAIPENEFLNSVSLGCSLGFMLCDKAEMSFVKSSQNAVSLSVYEDLRGEISEYINAAKPLFEKLGSAKILSYERNGDIAVTKFDNGVTVCVNYGDKEAETEIGTVKAKSFIYN